MTHHCTPANQRRRMLSNPNSARETNSPFAPMMRLTDKYENEILSDDELIVE